MVLRQHEPMGVEETVVVGKGADGGGDGVMGLGAAGCTGARVCGWR